MARMDGRWRVAVASAFGAAAIVLALATSGARSMVQAGLGAGSECTKSTGLPNGFGKAAEAGMARVPEGSLRLGTSNNVYDDERPTGDQVRVPAFWIDRTEVTNAQFAAFVKATGYVTEAEREGAAAVFVLPRKDRPSPRENDWWVWTQGANWRLPQGPGSDMRAQPNEPVVLVTVSDALSYARWLGHDLPTEAEWEYAARGGGAPELIEREPRDPRGRPVANYWQGVFPDLNTTEDGFAALASVGCFAPNGYGLSDMVGNVWELTRDRYTGPHQPHGNGNPSASAPAAGAEPRRGDRMVIKGGSFLCAENYCMRYRAAARYAQEADLPTSHVGFRTVLRVAAKQAILK